MTFKLSFMRSRAFAATAVGLVLIAGGAVAQQAAPNIMQPIEWDKRRLDQLDRNVRRLERALTQRNAAGEPVLVEPDPEVVTLQGQFGLMNQRLEDLEATVRRINGDNERLTFQLDEAQRDTAALRARLLDAEARIEKLETAAELNAPIEAHSPTGDAAQDLAAAVQLMSSDRARGARALETVVAAWPDTPQAREANSRLGDIRASSNDKAGAVPFYAAALKDWPRIGWAADTTLKLADALFATNRKTQGCAALGEFTRRYAPAASDTLKARATQMKTANGCS
ncbi:MAG: tol-pal system protein [Alphaproteobacteria bacterium]|uniref:Tol-pal system protein n=1 Tax=Brevundimonas mediterranea TaxID=74329 RepID=A0A7Z8Y4M1_9CAUL|nr:MULTISPECIES: tol-pal system protein [Brevundimonas]MBU1271750.1 tol-pal system protein [Alphaproteobacteria bacterium]MBJ7319599.1 tol-pal system protein [Brevundimonas sp.]MBU1522227.1 tol-pal system protein [Alphaproteobacteria bacterium]MBU2032008.1 tol-pal system protein [Alphaproteobacteria bacterium]MBU2165233.1 tol-pal system protein [Alphaproteobacteria bacterium]